MQLQLNTDSHIQSSEGLSAHVKTVVERAVGHHAERLSRVEVHLTDENGRHHGAEDKRCVMEARIDGHQPVAVTCHAASIHEALGGAAQRLHRSLDHSLGRLKNHH